MRFCFFLCEAANKAIEASPTTLLSRLAIAEEGLIDAFLHDVKCETRLEKLWTNCSLILGTDRSATIKALEIGCVKNVNELDDDILDRFPPLGKSPTFWIELIDSDDHSEAANYHPAFYRFLEFMQEPSLSMNARFMRSAFESVCFGGGLYHLFRDNQERFLLILRTRL